MNATLLNSGRYAAGEVHEGLVVVGPVAVADLDDVVQGHARVGVTVREGPLIAP